MPRYSANGTKISHKVGAAYVEIPMLMEVPEFGGTPEKIDVTALADKSKNFLNGIKDYGDLVFKFIYDNTTASGNFRILKGYETAGTAADFQLTYPDGTGHQFKAIPAVKMDAGTVNGALTFSCTMTLMSDVVMVNPA